MSIQVAPCGCVANVKRGGMTVESCSLHSAAPDLLEACKRAVEAMQSAWYELEPGKAVMGDQFIKQDDMDKRLALVRAAIAKAEGKLPSVPVTAGVK